MRSELILVLILSIVLDRAFGEPPDSWHPTVYMGKLIGFLDARLRSGTLIFIATAIPFFLLAYIAVHLSSSYFGLAIAAVILKTTFSWRGLRDYNIPIGSAIDKGDIQKAKDHIPFIAGRDPEHLDAEGILSTSIESIAESSVDSVLSPLFFFAAFSYFSLESGVVAAVIYRTANTLDSMLGQLENPKGRIPAKVDEILNLIPARTAAVLVLISSAILTKPAKRGIKIFARDRNNTRSKNAGQTMSAMAGVLGVRLKKKGDYILGDPDEELSTRHIYEALKIVDLQVLLFTALLVVSWI
jgi:adenosylcobinamide-phosphate synthase